MALETGWDESSRWDGEGEMRIKIRALPWAAVECPFGTEDRAESLQFLKALDFNPFFHF